MTARRNGIPTLAEAVDLSPATLFAPPVDDWRSRSLCSQLSVTESDAMFYPERGQSLKAARALCSECCVRAECLAFALENREEFGVWGGMSPRERRGKKAETAA